MDTDASNANSTDSPGETFSDISATPTQETAQTPPLVDNMQPMQQAAVSENEVKQVSSQQNQAVEATTSGNPEYAGFILRWAAFVVDSLIVGIPWAIIAYMLFGAESMGRNDFSGLILLIYFSVLTGLYQTTPGKKLFHLKVVGAADAKISMGKAFLRDFVGKIISSVVLSLGYLWVIWDKEKQSWHDKIAGTHVVITKPISKGKMFLAYLIVLILPLLAIAGIAAVVLLVAINPAGQLEKAREAAEESQRQMLERQQELEQIESDYMYEYSPEPEFD
jgi:uncharacterized RDD family membrane protein YckC